MTDANGQALAYVYCEPDPDNESRGTVMNRLTRDEARRIAVNVAKLPDFIEADKGLQGASESPLRSHSRKGCSSSPCEQRSCYV